MQDRFHDVGKISKCLIAAAGAIFAASALLAQQPQHAAQQRAQSAAQKPAAAAQRQAGAQAQGRDAAKPQGISAFGENFSRHRRAPEQSPKTGNELQGPFYFVDENPMQVIKVLEELTGQVAIPAAGLPNVKINFSSKGRLPRDEAALAIKSLLSANGMAVVPLGDKFFKVSPSQGVNAQAPTYISGKASDLPASNAFASKLYELQYVDIDTLAQTLATFVSPNNVATLALFPRSNAFFLTDTVANHQRIEMLLDKIDAEPSIREEIGFSCSKTSGPTTPSAGSRPYRTTR